MAVTDVISAVSSRFSDFSEYVLGPQARSSTAYLQKFLGNPLAVAAHGMGVEGPPKIILPVWVHESAIALRGPVVEANKPLDGVVAFWDGTDYTFLAVEARRKAEVSALPNGRYLSEVVEFRKKKTTVPGLVASDGALHLALGTRNAISVGKSWTDKSKPHFEAIASRLSGTSA